MRSYFWILFLTVTFATSCGLRDRLKERRQADADRAARRNAENSHEFQKVLAARDAEIAKKEYDDRRRYFYAFEGNFVGSLIQADGSSNSIENSIKTPNSEISIQLQVENDFVKLPDSSFTTLEQFKVAGDALSFSLLVHEESWFPNSNARLYTNCTQKGLKPDLKNGTLNFTCQTVSASGREYAISIDDPETDPQVARLLENYLALAVHTSDRLVQGDITQLQSLNLKIRTPFGKEFFAKLERIKTEGRSEK